MPLSVLCDEHIKYYVIEGLRRQGVDAVSVQQVHLDATDDELIISAANQLGRVICTCDDDFVRINSTGIPHLGILYHHALMYSIGDAIRAVALACQVLSPDEMRNRVEFL